MLTAESGTQTLVLCVVTIFCVLTGYTHFGSTYMLIYIKPRRVFRTGLPTGLLTLEYYVLGYCYTGT